MAKDAQILTWSASNIGLFCKKKSRHLPGSHTHSPLLQTELRTYKFGQNLGNLDNCAKSITMDNILQLRALDNDRCGIMFNICSEDIHTCIHCIIKGALLSLASGCKRFLARPMQFEFYELFFLHKQECYCDWVS